MEGLRRFGRGLASASNRKRGWTMVFLAIFLMGIGASLFETLAAVWRQLF